MATWLLLVIVIRCAASFPQVDVPQVSAFHPNLQARVAGLHTRLVPSTDANEAVKSLLESILHDPALCCEKDSALANDLPSMPSSLEELSRKLKGRHALSDGRWVTVAAGYLSPASINPHSLIDPLLQNRPFLMEWNSRIYLLYGAIFDETIYYSGQHEYVIRKLLLIDPRLASKKVIFDRQKDDWNKVQGLLQVSVSNE